MRHSSRTRRRTLAVAAISIAVAAPTVWASAAEAAFHLMKVREVYAGSAAAPGAQYVQLQAYASGQQFVMGHTVRTYGPTGAATGENTFGSNVADGRNQMTILVATPQAESQFGVTADSPMDPGQLSPTGGAVCFENIDCVAWGSFQGSLPSPVGSPAEPEGIPDGMALRRTIEPNCPTLLEDADDRNDSRLDFFPAFPDPRPNSVAPSERPCSDPSRPQPGQTGDQPPPDSASALPPGAVFAARTALTRGRAGLIRVLCRGQSGASCRGVMRFVVRVRRAAGHRAGVRSIVIGAARYNLPVGRDPHGVRFGLNRIGVRLVRLAPRRGLRTILVGRGLRNRVVSIRVVGTA